MCYNRKQRKKQNFKSKKRLVQQGGAVILAVERRRAIFEQITENGRALVSELSTKFCVTEETVRKDLEDLERRGLIVRIHGGAVAFEENLPDLSAEIRETVNSDGKKSIANICSQYIKKGDTLFFDASTTVYYLAKKLKNFSDITIITNSLRIINELSGESGINVICTGGKLLKKNKSFISQGVADFINGNFYADKCFLSCAGVLSDGTLLESTDDEVFIKRAMLKSSKEHYFLCDKTKIGRNRPSKIGVLSKGDFLITDVEKDNDSIKKLAELEVNIKFIK